MFEELVWPVVHNPSDKSLHVTELTVDTEDEQHHEEDGGPEYGAGQRKDLDNKKSCLGGFMV